MSERATEAASSGRLGPLGRPSPASGRLQPPPRPSGPRRRPVSFPDPEPTRPAGVLSPLTSARASPPPELPPPLPRRPGFLRGLPKRGSVVAAAGTSGRERTWGGSRAGDRLPRRPPRLQMRKLRRGPLAGSRRPPLASRALGCSISSFLAEGRIDRSVWGCLWLLSRKSSRGSGLVNGVFCFFFQFPPFQGEDALLQQPGVL